VELLLVDDASLKYNICGVDNAAIDEKHGGCNMFFFVNKC